MSTDFQEIESIITEDIQSRLIAIRDRDSLTAWDLGRVIVAIYAEVRRHRLAQTKDDVCVYVARFMDSEERSLSSMRIYARIAQAFPGIPEDRYPLPFRHFVVAARYGDQRMKVLSISEKLMEGYGGRPVSAAVLERHLELQGLYPTETDDEEDGGDSEGSDGAGRVIEVGSERTVADERKMTDMIVRLERLTDELQEIAKSIHNYLPLWANQASQLARMCGRIQHEIEESQIKLSIKRPHIAPKVK